MAENILKPVKFLVYVDDTENAQTALRFACQSAKKRGGLVDLVTVIDTADYQSFPLMAEKMRNEKRVEAEDILQKFSNEAYKLCGVTPSLILKEGKVGEQILSAVEEDFDADMFVIGANTSESGGISELVAWLTSQLGKRLLIPILVVPGNLTDLQIDELT